MASVPQNIDNDRKVVTTAGIPVALPNYICESVMIQAELDNTGVIIVGGLGIVGSLPIREGIALSPGDIISIDIGKTGAIMIDSTVSGDGVTFAWTQ